MIKIVQSTSKLIVITGLPATGKTWLATEISKSCNIPLFTKDELKIDLLEKLGTNDRSWDIKVGIAAVSLQMKLAHQVLSKQIPVILESNYKQEFDAPLLLELIARSSSDCLQFVCGAEGTVLIQRYKNRAHSDRNRSVLNEVNFNNIEEWRPKLIKGFDDPLELPGNTIRVDTTDFSKVDLEYIKASVRDFLST